MNVVRRYFLSIFTAFFLFSSSAFGDKTLVFPNDPWPPFMLGEEGEEATAGIGVDLMRAIFSRVDGATITIPLVPWKRALNSVKSGAMDGIPLLYKTAERESYMDFSDPLFPSQDLVWYSKNHFPNGLEWKTADDFSPYRMGIVSGYSYSEEIDKAIIDKKFAVTKVKNTHQLFTLLAGGRVDVAIANRVVGTSLIKKDVNNRHIIPMKKPIAEDDYYMAFSKKTSAKAFLSQVNKAIAELKAEGEIERIVYGD
ncbi:substrate-binding periplasmic protein [Eionea flava]